MMLTLHGLPSKTKFQDVKSLIKQECNIPDFILDNLVDDGYDSKKVRIGLTNENDGYRLMKCLEGFRMSGSHVLKVVPVGKPASLPQSNFEPRSNYSNQPRNDYQSRSDYPSQDYGRPTNNINTPTHISPQGSLGPPRNIGASDRHGPQSDRMLDSRHPPQMPDRYDSRLTGPSDRTTDIRTHDPGRGLLVPPTLRGPIDTRSTHGNLDSRGPHSSLDSRGPQGSFDSRGPHASLDSRGPNDSRATQSSYDSRGPHGSLDSRGPHGSLDSRGPHGANDNRGPNSSLNSRGPHVALDSRAPHAALDSRGPQGLDSRGGQGSLDSRGPHGSFDSRGPVDQRQGNPEPNRQPQWSTAGNANDSWTTPQNSSYNYQQPQGNAAYGQQPNTQPGNYTQGRAPSNQGYMAKTAAAPERASTRLNVLRSVEIVDTPIQPRPTPAYPPQHKPITIMKENFQGPSQYNVTGQPQTQTFTQTHAQPTWGAQSQTKQLTYDKSYDDRRLAQEKRPDAKLGPQPSQDYDKRRFSPTRGRLSSPTRRLISPPRIAPSELNRQYPEQTSRSFQTDRRPSPNRHVTSGPGSQFPPSTRRDSPPRKVSPLGRRVSPSRRLSPGRRNSPLRKISPTARNISPGRRNSPFRKSSPSGHRMSPGRRISPAGRRISPAGRRISPAGRRISPAGRRISPAGRRISPAGRRISPAGRRISPTGKRVSPGRNEARRMSPSMMRYSHYVEDGRRMGGRLESPPRSRFSPKRSPPRNSARYSPSDKAMDKYDPEAALAKGKPIRPAYEPSQASKFSGGGFRPIDSVQYPVATRAEPKISPWQADRPSPKKDDRDRMGRPDPMEKKRSPRLSRSPRRSRSPVKDRFKRHSPSPRSPRRSWALEKRRSPEIREPPPPPLWPGRDEEVKPQHPVWAQNQRPDTRPFDDKRPEKYTSRFSPRRDDDYREDKFDYRERQDYRRDSPRRDEKKVFHDIDKDINDIYQRAVEFRRKTEERQAKSGNRRREYDSGSSEDEFEIDKPPAKKPEWTLEKGPAKKPEWTLEKAPVKKQEWVLEKAQPKKPEWTPKIDIKVPKEVGRFKLRLDPEVKAKRDKAVDEIATKMLEPYTIPSDVRRRVMDELKLNIYNIMLEMFKAKDVSYIELVIKFRARYDAKDEEKILQDVLSMLPKHYKKSLKRKAEVATEVPAKVSRPSPEPYDKEEPTRPKLADATIPDWNVGLAPPKVLNMPLATAAMPVNAAPMMVQPPMYIPSYQPVPQMFGQPLQPHMVPMQPEFQPNLQPNMQANMHSHLPEDVQLKIRQHHEAKMSAARDKDDVFHLYLCQDDFEPFSDNQAERLKTFLVSQMFKASETGDGWAPDFALKGLHSMYRYELSTRDERSKDWIIDLDFSDFEFFNVLVYTKEELWYERAAIWLPGHSRYMKPEPLEKLRLQNQHAEGVNIGKWKFVKKVVTAKGTRLYVDMPPSSARALEKKNMLLSYELQKVNVYLKAVAVDKDSFDAGLKEFSITDPSQLANAVQTSIMPTINVQQAGLVKVTLNGAKTMTIQQAGKIKEMILYNLFKYHQQEGRSKTDFVKYGFCPPTCIGIVPENNESKRWLMSRFFGKLNKQNIVVSDGDEVHTKYFRLRALIPKDSPGNPYQQMNNTLVVERFKKGNRGVRGLNFHLWKTPKVAGDRITGKINFEVDADLESVEAIMKMRFKLDYALDSNTVAITFKSDYSLSKLEEKIRKYKSELHDSYDVANMEIDSNSD